jgi:hypothetical protein
VLSVVLKNARDDKRTGGQEGKGKLENEEARMSKEAGRRYIYLYVKIGSKCCGGRQGAAERWLAGWSQLSWRPLGPDVGCHESVTALLPLFITVWCAALH